jgi:hypothetical protein
MSRSLRQRKRNGLPSVTNRSAITNGKHLLVGVLHNTAWMRRFRDLIQLHINDLGGADLVSSAEQRLVNRAAMLTVQLELMDARFAQSEDVASRPDLETYQRCSNSLRRLLESLGLERRAREVVPTVEEYLASKEIEAEIERVPLRRRMEAG